MYLYKYKDYKDYKDNQVAANKRKVGQWSKKTLDSYNWVDADILYMVVEYIILYNPDVSFGLCHGTRQGVEQKQFMEDFRFFGKEVEVLGTEISDTAEQFENTIEWDFHDVKEEWLNKVDFIYTNSFDHSYDPEKCLDAWMSCLTEKGLCIIEWTSQHSTYNEESFPENPFVASLDEYKNIIEKDYEIATIMNNTDGKKRKSKFIFIKNKAK